MMLTFLLVVFVSLLAMFMNSYVSSQKLIERKYALLLYDLALQSSIRIEEFLNDAKKISLVSSYGINSYVSVVSQDNYPMQNFLRNDSIENEKQVTQLLMNYITMKDQSYSFYIYNFNGGRDLFVSSDKPINYTYNPRHEPWFKAFLASEDIVKDWPAHLDLQSKQENNWAIYHMRKIFDLDDGQLIGIMVVSIDLDFINKLIQRLHGSIRSSFTIVNNDDGRVIFNSDYTLIGKPAREVFPFVLHESRSDANWQVASGKNEDYLLVQAPFQEHDWSTYLYIPVQEMAMERDLLRRNLLIFVAVLSFFAFLSSFYLSNLITRPIKRLMKNMTLVEQGKFDNLLPVGTNDEIGLLSARFEQMSAELKRLVERIYKEQEEKTEAEIRALQAQINPHFLYNTLNSLKWIASMQRADKIVEMTEALISFLRYSTKGDNRLVSIREELQHVRHYISIQKIRYFNRISVRYDIDEEVLDVPILKLSIQPLVENAIFHGIAELEEEGTITISVAKCGEHDVTISVHDNGKGMDEETAERLRRQLLGMEGTYEGIGISNVHNRICRFFGEGYGIAFSSKPGEGSTFTITIPRSPKES